MKNQLIEFLLCSAIASYCMARCIKILPKVIDMAYNTLFVAKERLEIIDKLIE